jgi:hypothetical protein
MAKVDSSLLQGLNEVSNTFSHIRPWQDVESYSGYLTVDKPNNGNMFFWFFPAEESPETAPVVIWLQVTGPLLPATGLLTCRAAPGGHPCSGPSSSTDPSSPRSPDTFISLFIF